jgi:hypothetical protein
MDSIHFDSHRLEFSEAKEKHFHGEIRRMTGTMSSSSVQDRGFPGDF